MLFFTQCEKEAIEKGSVNALMELKSEEGCSVTQTLWAGAGQNNTDNGTPVGTVTATVDGNMLHVVYDILAPWSGVEYHLWVGKRRNGNGAFLIPRNAAPGLFPFKGESEYNINLENLGFSPGEKIYIAAHAVVAEGDLESLEAMLPEVNVVFRWTSFLDLSDPVSYFKINIEGDGWLAGDYDGWCADPEEIIGVNPRSGTVYSSYDADFLDVDLTPYAFDYPENLPLVNWVLNNDFVSKASDAGGNFTLGDVQRAIWLLLWEDPDMDVQGGVGQYNDVRVDEIIDMANTNGVDFMPGCDEFLVLVIVQNVNELHLQPVFIKIPVPCGGEETAWAFGDYTFIEEGIAEKWGWIFEMTYCEEEE